MAIKISLRKKPISKGRHSLYLDFYPPITIAQTGKKTRREFLGLYIIDKPKSPLEKLDNKNTLLLGEQIRQKRDNELNKPEVYNAFELEQLKAKEKGKLSFISYYEEQMEKKNGKNYAVWTSSFAYLKDFTSNSLTFADLNEKFCNDYRDYLLTAKSKRSTKTTISQNTAQSYFNKFKATLKQAFKDDLLPNDLNGKIKPIKQADTNRVFLSIEELNKLANTDCIKPILKKASLFSALTGLRFSDIEKLTWSEVVHTNDRGYSIQFQQKKTKSNEYLPIPEQAYNLMGEPKEPTQKVFRGLSYSAHQNSQLLKWAISAGIQKHLTFHCFRHTYATLQLSNGTDIYTVSKMLGHKDLKTTQVYAKIVDESKRKATERIKLNI
ncbi:site-specific integrase [Aquimarina sp. RZ0]|uniref:site-specific integrase n=1 Tax=Aquimarina sp. RZ0 TaxID=2607730 RepID=UPI0011F1E64E|nr:site-specific integrase [Aquimarina sp. RZ0]KAA1247975.1 site-specific integrase [Aquimarina sp. RZ0]